MIRFPLLAAAAATLAACTTTPPQPQPLSADGQAKLQQLLAGKVAGAPSSCIPRHRADDMVVISDDLVLYKDGSNRVYRQDFGGAGCSGLASGFYAMQTRSSSSNLCRGDIVQVVDVRSGMLRGACTFGDFVPFTRPAA